MIQYIIHVYVLVTLFPGPREVISKSRSIPGTCPRIILHSISLPPHLKAAVTRPGVWGSLHCHAGAVPTPSFDIRESHRHVTAPPSLNPDIAQTQTNTPQHSSNTCFHPLPKHWPRASLNMLLSTTRPRATIAPAFRLALRYHSPSFNFPGAGFSSSLPTKEPVLGPLAAASAGGVTITPRLFPPATSAPELCN